MAPRGGIVGRVRVNLHCGMGIHWIHHGLLSSGTDLYILSVVNFRWQNGQIKNQYLNYDSFYRSGVAHFPILKALNILIFSF